MESIEEIKAELSLGKIEAIKLTDSDTKKIEMDSNYFKDWYEEELRNIYTSFI